MKTVLLSTMILMAALNAAAETTAATAVQDPLTKQIMSRQLTQTNGGVTGAVRIGSGQAITLSIADPLSPAPSDALKDAVADSKSLDGLKPVEGLKPKAEKPKARRKARNAGEQLRKLSDEQRKADWSGRK